MLILTRAETVKEDYSLKACHKPDVDALVAEALCAADTVEFAPLVAPLEGATIVITIFLRTVCD